MTLIRDYRPTDQPALLRFVEDVLRALTANVGGISWRHNIGPTVFLASFVPNDAPFRVRMPLKTPPATVVVLRATHRDTGAFESGARVVWTTLGEFLVVTSIDLSQASDAYDVTLGLMAE